MQIGFIGLGKMGMPMALNLNKSKKIISSVENVNNIINSKYTKILTKKTKDVKRMLEILKRIIIIGTLIIKAQVMR